MPLKKIVILHHCFGNEDMCLFTNRLKGLLKDYPDDTIIENRIIKKNTYKN